MFSTGRLGCALQCGVTEAVPRFLEFEADVCRCARLARARDIHLVELDARRAGLVVDLHCGHQPVIAQGPVLEDNDSRGRLTEPLVALKNEEGIDEVRNHPKRERCAEVDTGVY